jgi:DNA-binding IclR family transcriptional regulator
MANAFTFGDPGLRNRLYEQEQCLKSESRGVQSVEVGARLLQALVAASAPMMLRDLAARANILPGQAHVYLTSFKKIGFVEQDRASGHYRIGPFAMRLAMARLHSDVLLQRGADTAAELSRDLGVAVTMTVWGCGAPTVMLVQEGPEEININLRPGRVYGVTTTATGRLFAAFRNDEQVQARIASEIKSSSRSTEQTRKFVAGFKAAVAVVRKSGYSIANGQPLPGINALAAPVFDDRGQLQFALTLVGRKSTLDVSADARPTKVLKARTVAIAEGLSKATPRVTAPA